MCLVCVTVAGTVVVASQIAPVHVLSDFTSAQKTLTSFSGSSSTLSRNHRTEIKSLVDKNPQANVIVCTGLTLRNASRQAIATARNRSKAACDQAKRLKPSLKVTVATKVTARRNLAGRVTVEIRTPKQSTSNPNFGEVGVLQDLKECRIADARITKTQPSNVGFPLRQDIIPASGKANFIVIPVDFSDRPASGDPTAYLKEQTNKMREWYEFFSKKKMTLEFQIGSSWVRAPKSDSDYQVPKSTPNTQGIALDTQRQLMQDIINAAGSSFDYSKAHGIFLYFPTIKSVDYDMGGRGTLLNTPAGQKPLFFWGGGAYHFDSRNVPQQKKREKMWAFWIHEILHSQDQALHGPGNGFQTGLGQDQYGASLVLSTWELFRFGWLDEQNIACIDAARGLSHSVKLKPLEGGAGTMRSAIIKISQFEALVFESRRPEGYSSEWGSTERGVFAYIIDTRLDSDRSGESTGADTGNDPRFQRWSYYLAPDGKDLSSVRGRQATRYLMQPGDTITYRDVKVTLDSSADTDNIRISQR